MAFSISDIEPQLTNWELVGNSDFTVTSCSSAQHSSDGSLCFVSDEEQAKLAVKGHAKVFVVPLSLKGKIQMPQGSTVIYVKNHSLAHAKLVELIHGRYPKPEAAIHATALVSSSARLGKNVRIGAHVVIGDNVQLSDEVTLGPNSVIEAGTRIGERTHIWANVFIGYNCEIESDCVIHPNSTIGSEGFGFAQDQTGARRIPQIGNVILKKRVEVGANVTIDRATFGSTIIGEGTKLDNLIHISHNVQIGKNCLLTAGFKIAGSSTLGDNIITGGHVLVTDHVNVCSNVRLAGWSGVNKDITEPGDYGGHPLQPVRDYMKTTMCLPYLPEFRRRIRELEIKVLKDNNREL